MLCIFPTSAIFTVYCKLPCCQTNLIYKHYVQPFRATHILEGKNKSRKDDTIIEEEEFSDSGSSKPIIKIGSSASTSVSIGSSKEVSPRTNGTTHVFNVNEWLNKNGKVLPLSNSKRKTNSPPQEIRRASPWQLR